MRSVLIGYCLSRRPSWKPKTQRNYSSAVVWLSFWFSTRFTRKKSWPDFGNLPLLRLWAAPYQERKNLEISNLKINVDYPLAIWNKLLLISNFQSDMLPIQKRDFTKHENMTINYRELKVLSFSEIKVPFWFRKNKDILLHPLHSHRHHRPNILHRL